MASASLPARLPARLAGTQARGAVRGPEHSRRREGRGDARPLHTTASLHRPAAVVHLRWLPQDSSDICHRNGEAFLSSWAVHGGCT